MRNQIDCDDATPANGCVFNAGCPARRILHILAEKWALLIIHALAAGVAMRTSELRRRITGVSEKMLIQSLRRLEEYGLVSRKSYPEVPPRVEYSLTPMGYSLGDVVQSLDRWVEAHAADIETARLARQARANDL